MAIRNGRQGFKVNCSLSSTVRQGARGVPVDAEALSTLKLIASGKLSGKQAKACFQAMFNEGIGAEAWMAQHGGQITDEGEIDAIVSEVIDGHPAQVADYLAGKDKLLGFFVGRVMAATRGGRIPRR